MTGQSIDGMTRYILSSQRAALLWPSTSENQELDNAWDASKTCGTCRSELSLWSCLKLEWYQNLQGDLAGWNVTAVGWDKRLARAQWRGWAHNGCTFKYWMMYTTLLWVHPSTQDIPVPKHKRNENNCQFGKTLTILFLERSNIGYWLNQELLAF